MTESPLSHEAKHLLKRLNQVQRYQKYTLAGAFGDETSVKPVLYGIQLHDDRDVQAAISAAKQRGSIVFASWHWDAPDEMYDLIAHRCFGPALRDIDAVAEKLARFKAAGVPVLLRPLYECSQHGWYWWSKDATTFKALWNMVYDRLVHHHALDHLLFVWNPAHNYDFASANSFYPGDAKVHVLSIDHPEHAARAHRALSRLAPSKPIGITNMTWHDWSELSRTGPRFSFAMCRGEADDASVLHSNKLAAVLPWK
jgi:hypothetical protein